MPTNNQLLAMIPALAVAALEAGVNEMITDGYWQAAPAVASGRTAAQGRDLRRASILTRGCEADLSYAEDRCPRRGDRGAGLARVNEAAGRLRSAEALYHAAWHGWYGPVTTGEGSEVSTGETSGEGKAE